MTQTQWKPFWRDRQGVFLPHTHLQCGSAQKTVMLVSLPVPQISSASSSSQNPCDFLQSPLINSSWTQNVSRERRVSSRELGQVKVTTGRTLAASAVGILCQVTHLEEPRSTPGLDVCWGRKNAHNVQQGSCSTRGVTVKLLPGCAVYKKTHTLGQRDGKEHVSFPHDVRRSAKTETSKKLATYWSGWGMPVPLHLVA